jgi:hypothetical protein
VPEVRRLVLAMVEPEECRTFRLAWSRWRRAHQAVARRWHAARLARGPDRPRAAVDTPSPVPPDAALTEAEWRAVRPLLPPQRPPTGRPRHDHRRVLSGILWVVRTRASWRDLPPELGKWETAYKRYRLWRDTGLWPRLLGALGDTTEGPPTEVAL